MLPPLLAATPKFHVKPAGKKKPRLLSVGALNWWRRRGLNQRPQVLYNAIYMLSPVIWF